MKLDIVFHQIRLGLFYMDHDLITRNLEKAQELIENGGDWDRKNRLKVMRPGRALFAWHLVEAVTAVTA